MATLIGVVRQVVGEVFAVAGDGTRRPLAEGDRVYAGEQLVTGAEGSIAITLAGGGEMTLGRGSSQMLDTQILAEANNSNSAQEAAAPPAAPSQQDLTDVQQLQAAIEAGVDPTQVGEATAAGPGAGGAGGAGGIGGGHSFVLLGETGDVVDPTIGYPTGPISSEPEFRAAEPEANPDEPALDGAPTGGVTAGAVDEEPVLNDGGDGDVPSDDLTLDGSPPDTATGSLGYNFGPDGFGSFSWNTPSLSSITSHGQSLTLVNSGLVLEAYRDDPNDDGPRQLVFKLTNTDPLAGGYEFVIYLPLDHPIAGTEDNLDLGFTYTITDGNGTSAGGSLSISVDDDTPELATHCEHEYQDEGSIFLSDNQNYDEGTGPICTPTFNRIVAVVHEDALTQARGDDSAPSLFFAPTLPLDAPYEGNNLGENGDDDGVGQDLNPAKTVTVSSHAEYGPPSLGYLVSYGADGPGSFGLVTTEQVQALLGAQALKSADKPLVYMVSSQFDEDGKLVSNTLTAVSDASVGSYDVFTLVVDVDGNFTFTLQGPLDHPMQNGDDNEGNSYDNSFSIDFTHVLTATDYDGDPVAGFADTEINGLFVINIEDDVPVVGLNPDAKISTFLDESLHQPFGLGGGVRTATIAADDVKGLFADPKFGADGPGDVTYALRLSTPSVDQGSDSVQPFLVSPGVGSGLYAIQVGDKSGVDVDGDGYGQGAEILLTQSGNIITGAVGGVTYFTIEINPADGTLTFKQLDNIWHSNSGNPDDSVTLNLSSANLLQIVQTATDGDGDPVSVGADVGKGLFSIEDDGPKACIELIPSVGQVTHDETAGAQNIITSLFTPGDNDDNDVNGPLSVFTAVADKGNDMLGFAKSIVPVVVSVVVYGADSENATQSLSLQINGGDGTDSGLKTTAGNSINLSLESNGIVVGRVVGGEFDGKAAFAVSLGQDGKVSIAQYISLDHPLTNSSDEAVSLSGKISAVITAVDGDGDKAVDQVAIGHVVRFEDDGPRATIRIVGTKVVADESLGLQDGDTNDAAVAALFTGVTILGGQLASHSFAQGKDALVTTTHNFGQDEEGAGTSLKFEIIKPDSGLMTTDGRAITLSNEGGLIVGRIAVGEVETGKAAFALALDADGKVSVARYMSLQHPVGGTSHDEAITFEGLVKAVFTVTDGDGDVKVVEAAIGKQIEIQDDGPNISAYSPSGSQLSVTFLGGSAGYNNSFGYYTKDADGNPVSGEVIWANVKTGSPDTVDSLNPDTTGFFIIPNGGSNNPGLSNGSAVTFEKVGGQWVAKVGGVALIGSDGSSVLFSDAALNVDGAHLTDNTEPGNQNWEDLTGSPDDDFNDVNIQANWNLFNLQVDETDLAVPGATTSGNFAGAFTINAGEDGLKNVGYSLKVVDGSVSNLVDTASSQAVLLKSDGAGGVVGYVDVNGAADGGEEKVFTLTVNATTGLVSLEQLRAIFHPTTDPDEVKSLASGLVKLTATVTDGDNDTAFADFDLGSRISFRDDSPTALDDIADKVLEGVAANFVQGNVLGNDLAGNDGGKSFVRWNDDADLNQASLVQLAKYGVLELDPLNGNYKFTLDNNDPDTKALKDGELVTQKLLYTMQDKDGDISLAELTIRIEGTNEAPTIDIRATDSVVNEAGLFPNGTDAGGNGEFAGGTFALADSDGLDDIESVTITGFGAPVVISIANLGNNNEVQGTHGTLTVTGYNSVTGVATYSYELTQSTTDGPGAEQDVFSLTTADGSEVSGPALITIGITDDMPKVSQNATVQLDDDALAHGIANGIDDDADSSNAGGTLGHAFGADGAGSIQWLTTGAPAGFEYVKSGDNLLIKQDGTTVLTVTLNTASGAYSVTQNAVIDHPLGNDENNVSFDLAYRVTDGDTDIVDGSLTINVDDDTPQANSNSGSVTEAAGKNINAAFVLDSSGSIDNGEFTTMMNAVKSAGQALFNGNGGDVRITIVAFSSDSTSYAPVTTLADFNAQVDSIIANRPFNGSTDFTDAIQETMVAYTPILGSSNQVFFISDGNPNEQTGSGNNSLSDATASAWNTFVDSNGINVTAIGVGGGINNARLQDVDLDGSGAPILVTNFGGLVNTLLAAVTPPVVPIEGNVLTNDGSGADVPLSFLNWSAGNAGAIADLAQYGTLALDPNGHYKFTLDNNAAATQALDEGDSVVRVLTYTAQDADGDPTTSTLTITIHGSNDSPIAKADTNWAQEDVINASGNMLQGLPHDGAPDSAVRGDVADIDVDDSLTVIGVTGGNVYGTLTWGATGTYTYAVDNTKAAVQALDDGEKLTETYTYTVTDGAVPRTATLTITVFGSNDAPVAKADTNWAKEDSSDASGNLLLSQSHNGAPDTLARGDVADSDVDGETLTVTGVTGGNAYGTLAWNANGAYSYILTDTNPAVQALDEGDKLTETYTYTVTDGTAPRTATLTITVFGTNDAPVANADTNWAREDQSNASGNVLENQAHSGAPDSVIRGDVADSDVDVEPLTVTGYTGGNAYGSLTLNPNGSYSYLLDNTKSVVQNLNDGDKLTETYTYTVTDGTTPRTATLTITIFGSDENALVVGKNVNDNPAQGTDHQVDTSRYAPDGDIQGGSGNDVLIGDIGGATQLAGQKANIAYVLDNSGSMTTTIQFTNAAGATSNISRLDALKQSVIASLNGLYNSGASDIRVHLVKFGTDAPAGSTFTLTAGSLDNSAQLIAAIAFVNAMTANGSATGGQSTNYEAGLVQANNWIQSAGANAPILAADVNKVLFVSDGEPNRAYDNNGTTVVSVSSSNAMLHVLGGGDGDNISEVGRIENSDGTAVGQTFTIESVGINVDAGALSLLSQVEGVGGSANNVTTANQLTSVIGTISGGSTSVAGVGNDELNGGNGNDVMFGDSIHADNANGGWAAFVASQPVGATADQLRATLAANHASYGQEGSVGGNDTLNGGDGNDILYGQAGNDNLIGGAGDDLLIGGTGADFLTGGLGNDTLTGGTGKDNFVWQPGDTGTDHVTDFQLDLSGVNSDVLDLSQLLSGEHANAGSLDSFLNFAFAGGSTTISVSAVSAGPVVQTIVLDGVDLHSGSYYGNVSEANIIAGMLNDNALKVDA